MRRSGSDWKETIMNQQNRQLREALTKIAAMASGALTEDESLDTEYSGNSDLESAPGESGLSCIPKNVPARLLVKAAEVATKINPVNAPVVGPVASVARGFDVSDPLRIAVLTAKYWGPWARRLTVSFMETTSADLQARIISHLNAWTRTAGISFVATNGVGDVRISRGPGGYYSYLGTDILLIPKNRQTMNLQSFTMNTSESEYKRVVRHEAGHTLGFPHEHMRRAMISRIDPAKAYPWFLQTYGWDKATVDAQVLTPLNEVSLMGTLADQTSIMCYQLPGLITKDGKPIMGGADINQTDYAFAGTIYAKVGHLGPGPAMAADQDDDWAESDDVEVTDVVRVDG
jgi:Astacin (Peptidase family M12A)